MSKRKERNSGELLDRLLGGEDPREAFVSGELFGELRRAVAERALGAEMEAHLDREAAGGKKNHRNGHNRKRVLGADGGKARSHGRVESTR